MAEEAPCTALHTLPAGWGGLHYLCALPSLPLVPAISTAHHHSTHRLPPSPLTPLCLWSLLFTVVPAGQEGQEDG